MHKALLKNIIDYLKSHTYTFLCLLFFIKFLIIWSNYALLLEWKRNCFENYLKKRNNYYNQYHN